MASRSALPARVPELWERFDRAVKSLGEACEAVSLAEIGYAFGAVAEIAHEIADTLERAGYGHERGSLRSTQATSVRG